MRCKQDSFTYVNIERLRRLSGVSDKDVSITKQLCVESYEVIPAKKKIFSREFADLKTTLLDEKRIKNEKQTEISK